MNIVTKFDIGNIVQMQTHDIHPRRFYDATDGNAVCGVIIGIMIDEYGKTFYSVKRRSHINDRITSNAEWELELVPTAPTRTAPAVDDPKPPSEKPPSEKP